MKKYYVLSIFLTFFSILSFGQLDIDTVFINREPSKGFAPYSVPAVLTDLSKNIYVFGASASPQFYSGIQVIKYDSLGEVLWKEEYEKSGTNYPIKLMVNEDNEVFTGMNFLFANSVSEVRISKYSPQGDSLWTFTFPDSDTITANAFLRDLICDEGGNVYLIGGIRDLDEEQEYFVTLKLNPQGDLLWHNYLDAGESDIFGTYEGLLIEDTLFISGSEGFSSSKMYVLQKYDLDGNVLEIIEKPIQGNYGDIFDFDKYGNFYFSPVWNQYGMTKLNTSGDSVFSYKRLVTADNPLGNPAKIQSIVFDEEDNIYLGGHNSSNEEGVHVLITKLSPEGTFIWEKTYSTSGVNFIDRVYDMAIDDQYLYCIGSAYVDSLDSNFDSDYLVLVYTLDGEEVAAFTHGEPNSLQEYGLSVVVSEDKFTVTGFSKPENEVGSILTIQYKTETTVNVLEPLDETLKIYPNPFLHKVIIDQKRLGYNSANVYDLLGRLVISEKITSTFHQVNLQGLSSGTYYLELIGDKGRSRAEILMKTSKF